jgi:hypothetical protein
MSIEAAISRITQLQAMMSAATTGAPVQAPPATAFSTALASATGDTAAPAATFASLADPTATTAATANTTLPAGTPYAAEITAAASANGLDPALLAGLIKQESGFNPTAGSSAGARGLTQLMPGTAAGLGVSNVLDPVQSINGGAKYLKQQLDAFGGDVAKALAAYNAGPGAVQRFGGNPPYAETQTYVRAVQANAASFRSAPSENHHPSRPTDPRPRRAPPRSPSARQSPAVTRARRRPTPSPRCSAPRRPSPSRTRPATPPATAMARRTPSARQPRRPPPSPRRRRRPSAPSPRGRTRPRGS